MDTMKISEIVLDFDLYPRTQVDGINVRLLRDALESGAVLPPVVVCRKSKRVVDGFHRMRAYRQYYDDDYDVSVDLRDYASDAEIFTDALRLNAHHGKGLSNFDRARAINQSLEFGLTCEAIGEILSLSVKRVEQLKLERAAKTSKGASVTLKSTARHLAGKKITKRQVAANEKASGMNQAFYVNQVINLFEGDLLDWENEYLVQRLTVLKELLSKQVLRVRETA
jgi:hypothetical protein